MDDEKQPDPLEQISAPVGDDGQLPPTDQPQPPPDDAATRDINQSVPAVATGGTKNAMVLFIALLVTVFMLYNIFSDDDEVVEVEKGTQATGQVPSETTDLIPPPPPVLPKTQLTTPPPPPPPPPLPQMGGDDFQPPSSTATLPIKKTLSLPPERAKSSMIVSGQSLLPQAGLALQGGSVAPGSEDEILQETSASQVKATFAGNPINLIAQGKIISAVLETAINSDLSGILRAVISRDVYAEAGKRVLIPKGSRLVGTYDISVKRGQSRVFIVWNRVIRPDGVDIVITSPGSDRLGRAGIEGEVDGKYLEIFSNAILLSTLTVAFAFAVEEVTDAGGLSERENTSGSVTTSGEPSDVAVVDAVADFGDIVTSVTSEIVNLKPTITVDQGTRIKVLVNKDIKFPSVVASDVVFIR